MFNFYFKLTSAEVVSLDSFGVFPKVIRFRNHFILIPRVMTIMHESTTNGKRIGLVSEKIKKKLEINTLTIVPVKNNDVKSC